VMPYGTGRRPHIFYYSYPFWCSNRSAYLCGVVRAVPWWVDADMTWHGMAVSFVNAEVRRCWCCCVALTLTMPTSWYARRRRTRRLFSLSNKILRIDRTTGGAGKYPVIPCFRCSYATVF
jgi:hypothetical protein